MSSATTPDCRPIAFALPVKVLPARLAGSATASPNSLSPRPSLGGRTSTRASSSRSSYGDFRGPANLTSQSSASGERKANDGEGGEDDLVGGRATVLAASTNAVAALAQPRIASAAVLVTSCAAVSGVYVSRSTRSATILAWSPASAAHVSARSASCETASASGVSVDLAAEL